MGQSDEDGSRLRRLKRLLFRAAMPPVPDHPANGGLTGDREWNAGDAADETADEPDETTDQ